jgi:signal peptidase I
MKGLFSFIWEVIKIVVIALVIVVPIRYFLFQPFWVKGPSMAPNFENGDYLIIDEISYRLREPQRGEVVVFRNPRSQGQRFIKRIIGLPGETIKFREGRVLISNGEKEFILDESIYMPTLTQTEPRSFESITLKRDEYFLLGDNRRNSYDSRMFGSLPRENIIGRVIFRAWPFTAWAKFETPTY